MIPDTNPASTFGTEVLDGTLTWYTGGDGDPNPAQVFPLAIPTTGRYVTIRVLTYPVCGETGVGSCNNSAGLSEVQVDTIPEPSSALLVVAGGLFVAIRRRAF